MENSVRLWSDRCCCCCCVSHHVRQLNIWIWTHQLMYWAASWGSCLEPSSTTRHCFICLKLASMSFFISEKAWIPLKELMTCCKHKSKRGWCIIYIFLKSWNSDSWDCIFLTYITESWWAMYLWLPRCLISSSSCWLSTRSWFSLAMWKKYSAEEDSVNLNYALWESSNVFLTMCGWTISHQCEYEGAEVT